MSNALKALLAAMVALLLLGACGDDDDTAGEDASSAVDEEEEEAPSANDEDSSDDGSEDSEDDGSEDSEFVTEAEAFCAAANQKGEAAFAQYSEDHPEAQQAEGFSNLSEDAQNDLSEIITGVFGDLVDDLRSLEPEGQEEEWTGVLDDFDDAVAEFEDDPETAFEEDSLPEMAAQLADFGVECGG